MHLYKSLSLSCFIIVALSLFNSCTSNNSTMNPTESDSDVPQATIVLDNNGSSSYSVSSVDGDGIQAETEIENPDIILTTGGRYTFINRGGAASHPLDFRNEEREKLLGQSRDSGLFDNDTAVNVQTDGDAITFTLTDEFAELIADYICSFHPSMNGSIIISNKN